MAEDEKGAPLDNVIRLFGNEEGIQMMVEEPDPDAEQIRNALTEALEQVLEGVKSGEIDGIILIGLATTSEYSASSFLVGPGVFAHVDRAIGLMERVKMDLVLEARGIPA